MAQLDRLLAFYDMFPFANHPLWMAVKNGELALRAVLRAEIQHYVRTKAGQPLRLEAVQSAGKVSPAIFKVLLDTYIEECTNEDAEPGHLELIERLLLAGGISRRALDRARPNVANSLAIAAYRDITKRGAGCHALGAGAVEYFYSELCPDVFKAYTEIYGMTANQAETYAIHGPMDRIHAERAFSILPNAVQLHGWKVVEISVRDAFAATSLHYDGMFAAATGVLSYWNGGRK